MRIRFVLLFWIMLFTLPTICLSTDTILASEYLKADNSTYTVSFGSANQIQSKASTQSVSGTSTAYTVIVQNLTPQVDPGDLVEMEAFITGFGKVTRNKLHITWSAPEVVGPQENLIIETYEPVPESEAVDCPEGVKCLQKVPMSIDENAAEIGVTINLAPFYFQIAEEKYVPSGGLPMVYGEGKYGSNPAIAPIFVRFKTESGAKSGDYSVAFTLTYEHEGGLLQDHKAAEFHINSRWERNGNLVTIAGSLTGLLALALAVFIYTGHRRITIGILILALVSWLLIIISYYAF